MVKGHFPAIKIQHGKDFEIIQFYRTLQQMALGISATCNLYVLDYLPTKKIEARKTCYCPNISMDVPSNDWVYLKNDQFKSFNKLKSYNLIGEYFAKQKAANTTKFEGQINKHSSEFFMILYEIFDIQSFYFEEININLVSTGVFASYDYENSSKILDLYVRNDSSIDIVFELIITAYVRKCYLDARMQKLDFENYHNTYEWLEAETISDFIMLNTKFKKLAADFIPTLKITNGFINVAMSNESDNYLSKLGLSYKPGNRITQDVNKNIMYNGKSILGLTDHEKKVLMLLSNNMNNSIAYEDIAEVLWGKDYLEKFSLTYINKLIFTLRQKIKLNKIHSLKIETHRAFGYLMRSIY